MVAVFPMPITLLKKPAVTLNAPIETMSAMKLVPRRDAIVLVLTTEPVSVVVNLVRSVLMVDCWIALVSAPSTVVLPPLNIMRVQTVVAVEKQILAAKINALSMSLIIAGLMDPMNVVSPMLFIAGRLIVTAIVLIRVTVVAIIATITMGVVIVSPK